MTGDALITCTEENPTHTGTHAGMAPGTSATGMAPGTSATGVALTIGDPRCAVGLAPDTRDPGCPNFGTP